MAMTYRVNTTIVAVVIDGFLVVMRALLDVVALDIGSLDRSDNDFGDCIAWTSSDTLHHPAGRLGGGNVGGDAANFLLRLAVDAGHCFAMERVTLARHDGMNCGMKRRGLGRWKMMCGGGRVVGWMWLVWRSGGQVTKGRDG